MKKFLLSILIIISVSISFSQSNSIRIMSYNLKQLPANNTDKNSFSDLKKIVNAIKPSILLTVELDGATAVQQILDNSLSNKYKASTEVKITWGTGNECAVFYIDSLLTYLGSSMITADTRPIAEFKFVHKFTKDTLTVFGAHLKAYPDQTARRLNAATTLRNRTLQLKNNTNYMVVGDFNIFTSLEPAFQKLLDQSSSSYFIDVLNGTGSWNANQANATICTYSPTQLDTRLDMILISPSLQEKGGIDYINNSYKTFGNDDGIHYGTSITNSAKGSNYWLASDPSLGASLTALTDHLPIYADFSFGVTTDVKDKTLPSSIELKQNYPNPFNPSTTINFQLSTYGQVTLKVYDLVGREISTLVNELKQPGSYSSEFSIQNNISSKQGFQFATGVYFYQLKVGNFVQTKKMVVIK